MAGFSQATLERIRAASDIVDVIGSYLPLKRAGANFVALCPFHKEKSPSFNVNAHRQIFHCFGCHKGGDVFTFVKEYENIGFGDAVRRLAERAKIPIEQDSTPGERQARHVKDQLLEIHEKIAQRWQNCLLNEAAGQVGRDYLEKRGVSPDAIKLFRLGAAPESWDDTVNWAKSKNYELSVIEKAGLIVKKEETGNYYDRFRGRLMFPICDEQGRVVAFSGRVLSGDEKTAKYVNSPETPIFTKGKVLFALDKAKRSILDADCAVVCEGQLDVISCHSRGVTHVVAPQGTALTAQQVQILRRYTNDVILCFDSDNAGRKAAARGFDELVTLNVPFRVAEIPPPDDPDSFLKKFGFQAFFDLLVKARDFFDWYLDYLSTQNDIHSDRGKIAVVQGMAELLKHPSTILSDHYAQKTAQKLGISADSVRAEFKKIPAKASKAETESVSIETKTVERPPSQEFWLLKFLLIHDELAAWATSRLDPSWVSNSAVRQIIERRFATQKNGTWKNLGAFLDESDSADMRSLITEAATQERQIPNPEKQLADLIRTLRNEFLDRQITALINKVSSPETPHAQKVELLQEKQILLKQKALPLEERSDG